MFLFMPEGERDLKAEEFWVNIMQSFSLLSDAIIDGTYYHDL